MKAIDYSLMFVTDERITDDADFLAILEASLKGGVSIVQLREKHLSAKRFYGRALAAKAICSKYSIPFIVNDRLDIALAVNADGVHLGQNDLPVTVARALLGDDKIIGWSVSNAAQAQQSNELPINYIGLSPIFNTPTKTTDLDPPLGIDGLKQLRAISKKPIVCIGGVNATNTHEILLNGGDGIAVVSAISQALNPEEATNHLKEIICQTGTKK